MTTTDDNRVSARVGCHLFYPGRERIPRDQKTVDFVRAKSTWRVAEMASSVELLPPTPGLNPTFIPRGLMVPPIAYTWSPAKSQHERHRTSYRVMCLVFILGICN